ncbi:MAG: OadG family protein [Anaerolineaceae bacterium]|nr:OadG family protein [Anaerolineaceae bacterium]
MGTDFSAGLQVSLLGLIITFVALGVFILIILALKTLFPAERAAKKSAAVQQAALVEASVETEDDEGEVVAVIAAALAYARVGQSNRSASLGSLLQEGRGSWWAARRSESSEGNTEKR